ncbi:MAG: DUF4058 family protein [Caldilineaceae bacterium]
MPTPFPGMDPYLERPNLWSNVHASLITSLRDYLTPLLRPRYFVSVEERSYLDDSVGVGVTSVPDIGVVGPYISHPVSSTGALGAVAEPIEIELRMTDYVRETYLEIIEAESKLEVDNGDEQPERWVVTLIEILSPWNKRSRGGREKYVAKRQEIIHSATNLVEIDLLRAGEPMTSLPDGHSDYSILVSPFRIRPRAHFYPFSVRHLIPSFQLPLQADDEEPVVDLNGILHELYDRAGYDLRINYRNDPIPPFEGDDAAWIDQLLRAAELRRGDRGWS